MSVDGCRKVAKSLLTCAGMCKTISTGAASGTGRPLTSWCKSSTPPADAPTTTTGKALRGMVGLLQRTTLQRALLPHVMIGCAERGDVFDQHVHELHNFGKSGSALASPVTKLL